MTNTKTATLQNPALFSAYASMSPNQQRLYDSMRLPAFAVLNAGNDHNGNPRRIWVVSNQLGEPIRAFDEGYAGEQCVPVHLRWSFDYAERQDCGVRQYQMLCKLGDLT
jgi:hypothetical protein|tara:strand:+ start:21274 stop:21600 length:327 start_codon:yes stop_codon:yes gene_type:complete